MPDEVIYCPACNHKLRVPESLLGQLVQCPECQTSFTAPVRVGDTLTPPAVVPAMRTAPEEPAPVPAGQPRSIAVQAIALMLVGLIGVFVFAGLLYGLAKFPPAELRKMYREQMEVVSKFTKRPAPEVTDAEIDEAFRGAWPRAWVFLSLSLVSVLAASAMLAKRFYRFALIGSFLSMVNLPCCLLSAPFGFWAGVVLLNPDVKAQFR